MDGPPGHSAFKRRPTHGGWVQPFLADPAPGPARAKGPLCRRAAPRVAPYPRRRLLRLALGPTRSRLANPGSAFRPDLGHGSSPPLPHPACRPSGLLRRAASGRRHPDPSNGRPASGQVHHLHSSYINSSYTFQPGLGEAPGQGRSSTRSFGNLPKVFRPGNLDLFFLPQSKYGSGPGFHCPWAGTKRRNRFALFLCPIPGYRTGGNRPAGPTVPPDSGMPGPGPSHFLVWSHPQAILNLREVFPPITASAEPCFT
jgi:hypothetical protein